MAASTGKPRKLLDYYYWQESGAKRRLFGKFLFKATFLGKGFFWMAGAFARRLLLPVRITPEPCDALIIHPSGWHRKLGRKERLAAALKARMKVAEITYLRSTEIIASGEYLWPSKWPGLHLFSAAAHAEYLKRKYSPKVFITEKNGDPFSTALRNLEGSATVHLPHSITTDDTRKFAYADFDWYLLFGQGSLDLLRRREILYGNSKVVLSGSYLLDEGFEAPPAVPARNILVFGKGSALEEEEGHFAEYRALLHFMESRPDLSFRVRLHPTSTHPFWPEAAKRLENLEISTVKTPMQEDLSWAGTAIGIYTNAIIEAAALGRPVILFQCGELPDPFGARNFFPRVETGEELSKALREIAEKPGPAVARAKEFGGYHLARGADSVKFIAETIEKIAKGGEPPHETLTEKGIDGL